MNKEIKPLSPREVIEEKVSKFDPTMIQAVNELLIQKFNENSGSALLKQDEIIDRFLVIKNSEEWTRQRIFSENLLDFESVYRKEGWEVDYVKPGYNESGYFYFEFIKK